MLASLALEPPALAARTSRPASSAMAVPERTRPDLPRNARRATSGEEYAKKLMSFPLCGLVTHTLDARATRLRSRLDPFEHVGDDAIAARAGEGEGIFEAAVDVARERFAQQAARAKVARAHRGFGNVERGGGFLHRQLLERAQ